MKKEINKKNTDLLNLRAERNENMHYIRFNKGGWSYYRQETVLFGIIADRILEKPL